MAKRAEQEFRVWLYPRSLILCIFTNVNPPATYRNSLPVHPARTMHDIRRVQFIITKTVGRRFLARINKRKQLRSRWWRCPSPIPMSDGELCSDAVAHRMSVKDNERGCHEAKNMRTVVGRRGQGWSGSHTWLPGKAYDWSGCQIIHFLLKNGIWSGTKSYLQGF